MQNAWFTDTEKSFSLKLESVLSKMAVCESSSYDAISWNFGFKTLSPSF